MKYTYKDAGVDKEAGYRQVQLIKGMLKKTYRQGVLSGIGGFSSLFHLDAKSYKEPVLVSGTDGVGTKLKLAFMMDKHDTIGEDCVAMCVNDILCQGAKPLFFLDYIATGKLIPEKMASIVEGIAEGCIKGELSLIGGETAEMPDFYKDDEYDLAGFCVGVVEKDRIIDGSRIEEGDIIIGLPSSGIHSNGYSLVRKIVFQSKNFNLDEFIPELDTSLGEELLKPTRIYTKTVMPLIEEFNISGIAHITGGGFYENIPRIVPQGLTAKIQCSAIPTPKIFNLLSKWGNIDEREMYSTFNMGIGMVLIVKEEEIRRIKGKLEDSEVDFTILGDIQRGEERIILW